MSSYEELCDRAVATGGPKPMRFWDGAVLGWSQPSVVVDQELITRVIEGECPRCHLPLARNEEGGHCEGCGWTWAAEWSGERGSLTACWVE